MELKHFKSLGLFLLLSMTAVSSHAQFTRSIYAIDGLNYRMQLNPALTPNQGYINIPVFSGIGASVSSNSLDFKNITNVIENSSNADYFTDNKFYNNLKEENKFNASVAYDIASAGWYQGKNFWSVNFSLKADMGAIIPRNIFKTMRDAHGLNDKAWANYSSSQGGEQMFLNSYFETGVGFARQITDNLTLGGKVKLLFGATNMKLHVKKLDIKTQFSGLPDKLDWNNITTEQLNAIRGQADISVEAEGEASIKGFEIIENKNGYIDDVKQKGSLGIAGIGAGIDLGATYKVMDGLTLSAAVLDLGFISWSKESTHIASSNTNRSYKFDGNNTDDVNKFKDVISDGKVVNFTMFRLKQQEGKARTTSLYSSIVLGGEYKLPDSNFSFGLLSTTRFTKPETQTELTLSTAYNMNRNIAMSLAYSMIQSGGKGLGIGLKLGPVTLATDYMYFGNSTKCFNAFVGFTIPLGSHKKS